MKVKSFPSLEIQIRILKRINLIVFFEVINLRTMIAIARMTMIIKIKKRKDLNKVLTQNQEKKVLL